MNEADSDKPKIIVDEDWKSQVQAERNAATQPPAETPHEHPPTQSTELPIPEASFSVLVTTLATQIMVALGQAPLPGEAKADVNLPFAKHCIDTLDILAQKTKGNLTTSEDHLLSQFLYELRMLYVAVQNQLKKQPTVKEQKG
ncbi:MAG: DUF1844 domain-containing protein [Pirellulaceae bacterium]